jgi:hypothetical protein
MTRRTLAANGGGSGSSGLLAECWGEKFAAADFGWLANQTPPKLSPALHKKWRRVFSSSER